MKGGLLEGFKVVWGGNNWLRTQILFVILAICTTLPIIGFIADIVLGLYALRFLHNALKGFYAGSSNGLLPKFDGNLFNDIVPILMFNLAWFVTSLVFVFVAYFIFMPMNTIVAKLLIICIFGALFSISFPYILASFAQDYNTEGSLSPLLLFSYLPKVFFPTVLWVVGLTIFAYGIPFIVALFIPLEIFIKPLSSYLYIISMLAFFYAVAGVYAKRFIN